MTNELSPWARVALLAASACVLFVAVASTGTATQPYVANEWAFSHVFLADGAVESGHLPVNKDVLTSSEFADNHGAFVNETGLDLLTFYASTVWHFWNGLPFHPSLVATLALATGLTPETVMRLPIGGVALVLVAYASAELVLRHSSKVDARLAAAAPFILAIACAPFALDMRVLMPSVTLVFVALMLHGTLRWLVLRDRAGLALGLVPLILLPFWYYTVAYFVIVLLVGFILADLALRLRFGAMRPVVVPPWIALSLCAVLTVALLANGALTSHVRLATQLSGSWIAPDAGSDYSSHLNRQPWRSALLYAEVLILFAPLLVAAAIAARRFVAGRVLGVIEVAFLSWSVGAAAWSLVLLLTVGVSFLNRTVIYLAPLAALAMTLLLARAWNRRWLRRAATGGCVALLVATTALVASAPPHYTQHDAQAYDWAEATVPAFDVVYAPLEVGSVLFRDHDIVNMLAFYPRVSVLDDVWYGEDPDRLVPYLASFDYLVIRKEVMRGGFEEFGPLRQPISAQAYAKFAASPDLDLVFDNGEVQVFRVALRAMLVTSGGGAE